MKTYIVKVKDADESIIRALEKKLSEAKHRNSDIFYANDTSKMIDAYKRQDLQTILQAAQKLISVLASIQYEKYHFGTSNIVEQVLEYLGLGNIIIGDKSDFLRQLRSALADKTNAAKR